MIGLIYTFFLTILGIGLITIGIVLDEMFEEGINNGNT